MECIQAEGGAMSELTATVQKSLSAGHPHLALSVEKEVLEGTDHLTVIGVDYQLAGPELTGLCIDLFTRARVLSDLPTAVSVQGLGDAGRRLDTELDNLAGYIASEYGVAAIVVFAWEHEGPEFGQIEVVTDDPIQSTILSAMLNKKSAAHHS
jgi:hypothetical protein